MKINITNSPFNEEQAEQLNELLQTLTPEQKMWLSGYILASEQTPYNEKESISIINSSDSEQNNQQTEAMLAEKEPEVTPETRSITILYGSETGNAQSLAEIFEERLVNLGNRVTLKVMEDFNVNELMKVEDLFIITSTYGEGDPPDNAFEFHEELHRREAPKLDGVRFSVLALGDQTYEYFCQAGKDFDIRLG